ncbi:MAG: glycosyltransferase [bacterium]
MTGRSVTTTFASAETERSGTADLAGASSRVLLAALGKSDWEIDQVNAGTVLYYQSLGMVVCRRQFLDQQVGGSQMQRLRQLVRELPRFGRVHLVIPPWAAAIRYWWLLVLAGRFFGCRITVDLRHSMAELVLEDLPTGLLSVLRRCHHVLVDFEPLAARLERQHVRAITVCPKVAGEGVTGPKATRLQPHLLALLPTAANTDVLDHSLTYLHKAFSLVKMKYPRTLMTVLADSHTVRLLNRHNWPPGLKIVAADERTPMSDYLDQADVFVNALAVGNPVQPVLTAMQHELVVVSTAIGSIPSLIDDGRNGRLVSLSRPETMANAVIHLIEHPESVASMRQQAGATVTGSNRPGSHDLPE